MSFCERVWCVSTRRLTITRVCSKKWKLRFATRTQIGFKKKSAVSMILCRAQLQSLEIGWPTRTCCPTLRPRCLWQSPGPPHHSSAWGPFKVVGPASMVTLHRQGPRLEKSSESPQFPWRAMSPDFPSSAPFSHDTQLLPEMNKFTANLLNGN